MATLDRAVLRQRFGSALRAWRDALGLDQSDIAAEMGVSRQTVGQWEAGEADLRHEQHYRLARFLGIDWLEYCREIGLEPYEGLELRDWWGWAYAQKIARRTARSAHSFPAPSEHTTAPAEDTSPPRPPRDSIGRYHAVPALG